MILVAGGTGTLGRETIARLTAADAQVRILTRRAEHASGSDVEVVVGDVRDPTTLARAVEGVSAVLSAVHGFLGGRGAGPEEVDHQGNRQLVRAAVDAGVEHFVLLSVLDAGPDHPMSLHRAKYAAEQELRASDLGWTVLRPSAYVETWAGIVGAKVASGGPALVFGRAANPINFVSVQDVAVVAQRALTDPAMRGRTIDLPGPENLTMTQLARALGAGKVRHVPRSVLRLLSAIPPAWAPASSRLTHAALVMDTTDMTADCSELHRQFPDIAWHLPTQVAERYRDAQRNTDVRIRHVE